MQDLTVCSTDPSLLNRLSRDYFSRLLISLPLRRLTPRLTPAIVTPLELLHRIRHHLVAGFVHGHKIAMYLAIRALLLEDHIVMIHQPILVNHLLRNIAMYGPRVQVLTQVIRGLLLELELVFGWVGVLLRDIVTDRGHPLIVGHPGAVKDH